MSKYFVLFALLLCLTGCGNRIIMSGSLVYEEDESPIQSGVINFSNEKENYSGIIKNGKYRTAGTNGKRGVPPGQYKVWFSLVQMVEQVTDPRTNAIVSVNVVPLIAEEYTSVKKTPLSFEVKPGGPTTFDIKVKKPEKKAKRRQ